MGYRGLTSFNVGFEGIDATFDESVWAIRAAERFGTKHHQVKIRPFEVRELMRSALAAVDLPSVDGFNHYLAFQAIARAGFKVAITGQGADELFYGYARHRTYAISHRLACFRIPSPVLHGMSRAFTAFVPEGQRLRKTVSLFALGTRSELAYASRHLVYTGEEMSHLLGRPVQNPVRFVPQSSGDTPLAQLYDIEVRHFLRNQLLRDGDQMSMAVSLELRAPFVDYRLVETVSSLPSNVKLMPGRQKPLLVDAIDDPLVYATARRQKFGFPFPLRRWVMEEINTESISPRTLGFDTPRARQVFARGKQGIEHMQAWLLSVLAVWMQENHIAPA
jgi:asparagine synthase (glutamine-hydrolysing)